MDIEARILFLESRLAAMEAELRSYAEQSKYMENETLYEYLCRIKKQSEEMIKL